VKPPSYGSLVLCSAYASEPAMPQHLRTSWVPRTPVIGSWREAHGLRVRWFGTAMSRGRAKRCMDCRASSPLGSSIRWPARWRKRSPATCTFSALAWHPSIPSRYAANRERRSSSGAKRARPRGYRDSGFPGGGRARSHVTGGEACSSAWRLTRSPVCRHPPASVATRPHPNAGASGALCTRRRGI
jgi:hypothetical protein